LLFLSNISLNYLLTDFNFTQLASISSMVEFVFILGFIEALILGIIYVARLAIKEKLSFSFKPSMILTLGTLVFAVILTIFL
jgi:uncharacterized membrane protein YciS (DUF1049 family)